MPTTNNRKSKADWINAALVALDNEGVQGIRVERLARDLGIAKSGFYWHFEDRKDLLRSVLRYWEDRYTGVVVADAAIVEAAPLDRLRRITEMIIDGDLARYDLAIRSWAEHDATASRAYRHAVRSRLAFVGAAFAELGFEDDELEMRTRLFVCYQSWEHVMFGKSKKERRRSIEQRIRLLTRP